MDAEDALEEFLRGPYEPCPNCMNTDDGLPSIAHCGPCNDTRRRLRELYRQSCRVLEVMPVPFALDIIDNMFPWDNLGEPRIEYERAAAVLELPGIPNVNSGTESIQYVEDNRALAHITRKAMGSD